MLVDTTSTKTQTNNADKAETTKRNTVIGSERAKRSEREEADAMAVFQLPCMSENRFYQNNLYLSTMAKSKSTPKTPLTPEIQVVKENIQKSLNHHEEFRSQCVKLYYFHHQMCLHLQEQLEQMERSEKNEQ